MATNLLSAFKFFRDQSGIPMAAVSLDVQMRTGQACADEIL